MEKAAQRAAGIAEMCARYKTMTLEQKKKELDAYVPSDFYKKGCFIDAQDTTNCFIMAKVVSESTFDINVNYDGWPERWNYVSAVHLVVLYMKLVQIHCHIFDDLI